MKPMSYAFGKISALFVLLSFLTLVFFSFASMTYGSDGQMKGDCPLSTMNASICPPGALPGAIHHISAYQSFINVPVNSDLATFVVALLVIVSIALLFSFHPILYRKFAFVYCSPTPFTSEDRKIKRRLSLFENSPPRY
jgi:hypothetical protein